MSPTNPSPDHDAAGHDAAGNPLTPPIQAQAVDDAAPGAGPARRPPPPPPPPRRRGRFWFWLGWLGFALCGVTLLTQCSARRDYFDVTGGITEKYHSGAADATDKIAIIAVRGLIMDGHGFVKNQIDRVRADQNVKAVVLRVDSPGGTVTGADFIYHHLEKLRQERNLPIVVSMGSIATSGGYYVSMAVGTAPRTIYAEPTTTTGSIGVIMPHYDLSGLLAKFEIEDDSIVSHPRKQLLSMTRPMSADDRKLVQDYVDESFARFKQIVKSGRPALQAANQDDRLTDPQSGRDLATGEVFTATQAKRFGLVDQIGFLEDVIDRAVELAQLDPQKVRVVQYQRPVTLSGMLGMAQAKQSGITLEQLMEWSAPRAYYLATTLPVWASSNRARDP